MKTNLKTNRSGACGFTLIELAIIIVTLAMLLIVALAALLTAREKSEAACCNCNLKQIGLAFRTWEGDFGDKYPMSVSTNNGGSMEWGAGNNMFRHYQVMSNELVNPRVMICPRDYRKTAIDLASFNNNNLSYFVGLDCDETIPAMIISGDRNLVTNGVPVVAGLVVITPKDAVGWSEKMHKFAGNVGLADGNVQQSSSASLQILFNNTGTNVNRLAVP